MRPILLLFFEDSAQKFHYKHVSVMLIGICTNHSMILEQLIIRTGTRHIHKHSCT